MAKAKKKRKQVTLAKARGDHGTGTEAATRGTYLKPIAGDANGTKIRVREHQLEIMRRAGTLSARQLTAGEEIRDLWEKTLKTPEQNFTRVDYQPDWSEIAISQMQAQFNFGRIMSAVPSAMTGVVRHVCCLGHAIRGGEQPLARNGREGGMHEANLRVALDLVANRMRSN